MTSRYTLCYIISLVAAANAFGATPPGAPIQGADKVLPLLENHCFSCHDEDEHKGDVRLDNLESLPLEARLDLLNRVQEQVYFGEMPPKKKKQPTEAERNLLTDWIGKELRSHNASKLEEKLRKPEYGNVVNHDKLFSGKYKDLPGYTPDRRWLISEFIFDEKMNRLLEYHQQRDIDGKRVQVIGGSNRNFIQVNVTNPFILPNQSGVRYYDTTPLNGGHLLTMISNAREFSAFVFERAKNPQYLPSLTKIMAAEWAHERILTARQKYMVDQIEPLLRELFKERHEGLLPVYVIPPPPTPEPDDGSPKQKPFFDMAGYTGEDKEVVWRTVYRHFTAGANGEDLIGKCAQDWFHLGLDARAIALRTTLMRKFMDQLPVLMPKSFPAPLKPPAAPELDIIRAAVLKHRKAGDSYRAVISKCMAEWRQEFALERLKTGGISDEATESLVVELFTKIFEYAPSAADKAEYVSLVQSYYPELGTEKAIGKLIETLLLRTDFVYRQEFGEGSADAHGRRMLSPRDASHALAYALTDSSPDKELQEAAKNGRLNTREDYRREIERMLKTRDRYYLIDEAIERGGADSFTNMPVRKLRFFREFFGYPAMLTIFKDNKRFGGNFGQTAAPLVSEADKLVEHILEADKNVFGRLLSTEEFYVYHSGDNKAMAAASDRIRKIYEYFKDKDWKNLDAEKLKTHKEFLEQVPITEIQVNEILKGTATSAVKLAELKKMFENYFERLNKGQTAAAPYPFHNQAGTPALTRTGKQLAAAEVAKTFNIDITRWNYPVVQPAKMENRKGILTHPAWLIAFAKNTESDPIHRGKWILEKLLAGTVPDVPITVDAKIPEDHTKTLRTRLEKATSAAYCWNCHERMNPLGTAFEMYDDFGRFRTEEFLEHPDNLVKKMPEKGQATDDLRDIFKTLPVVSNGRLNGTGDPALDGDVRDALDLTSRLAKSAKVRQSIIRYAFRYFMGRNEFLSDSKTLMDADQAYVQSGGSFDAVIVSLLTSDSFIYHKPVTSDN